MSLPRKLMSCLELVLFLGATPLWIIFQENYLLRRCSLLAAAIYAFARLWGKVSWRGLFARPGSGWWKGPLARCAVAGGLILAFVLLTNPDNLFNLPREHFWLWVLFVTGYPILSVLPQELIYRIYIFEVHKTLLTLPFAALLTSALSFAWMHIIFAGWFAPLSSFAAGLALSWNYQQNRRTSGAVWPLLLEHTLYGQMAFTLGAYEYFFIAR